MAATDAAGVEVAPEAEKTVAPAAAAAAAPAEGGFFCWPPSHDSSSSSSSSTAAAVSAAAAAADGIGQIGPATPVISQLPGLGEGPRKREKGKEYGLPWSVYEDPIKKGTGKGKGTEKGAVSSEGEEADKILVNKTASTA